MLVLPPLFQNNLKKISIFLIMKVQKKVIKSKKKISSFNSEEVIIFKGFLLLRTLKIIYVIISILRIKIFKLNDQRKSL